MRVPPVLLTAVLYLALPAHAQTLDIYFVDTEGGQATLFVSPQGESLLVDTGNSGDRDLGRILDTLDVAGVDEIDHLILTHYHGDHYGSLLALADSVTIRNFYDHGASVEERPNVRAWEAQYAAVNSRGNHVVVKPGDRIPFAGTDVIVMSSQGEVSTTPIPGARGAGLPNPACSSFVEKDERGPDDNDASVGVVLSFGAFRMVNLGDLTWNREGRMMCPNNPIGTVDLYLTSHHGLDRSGSAALVHGLQPRVIVMNNGTRKGGNAPALEIIHSSPGLEDLWQLHWAYAGLAELNAPGVFIANLDAPDILATILTAPPQPATPGGGPPGGGAQPGTPGGHSPAHYIKVSAQADGSFTVTNSRNGFSKRYAPVE